MVVPTRTASAAPPTLQISAEVAGTSTSCTAPPASVRNAADLLDDSWRAAAQAAPLANTVFSTAVLGATTDPDRTPSDEVIHAFPSTPYSVAVSKRSVTSADASSMAAGSFGTVEPVGFRDPYHSTSPTLQDCAPRPASIYSSADQPRFWNALYGSGSTLDAVLFRFNAPLSAFGVFVGDLETRTDGEGVAARVKLFDADGRVLSNDAVPTSTLDQSLCGGGDQTTDFIGCGNQSTRWIGFLHDERDVAAMLIVVGDDDSCAVEDGDCNGFTEHLSAIGMTIATRSEGEPTTTVPTTSTPTSTTSTTVPTTTSTTSTTTTVPTTTSTTSTTTTSTTVPTTTSTTSTTSTTTSTTAPTTTTAPTATPTTTTPTTNPTTTTPTTNPTTTVVPGPVLPIRPVDELVAGVELRAHSPRTSAVDATSAPERLAATGANDERPVGLAIAFLVIGAGLLVVGTWGERLGLWWSASRRPTADEE